MGKSACSLEVGTGKALRRAIRKMNGQSVISLPSSKYETSDLKPEIATNRSKDSNRAEDLCNTLSVQAYVYMSVCSIHTNAYILCIYAPM